MSAPIIPTKIAIPPPRTRVTERTRLVIVLDEALREDTRLALLSAPPGFGKTTLLSTWAHQLAGKAGPDRVRVSWLSLDEGDTDPGQFFSYLVASPRNSLDDIAFGEEALRLLR